jgi:hypothetical protein
VDEKLIGVIMYGQYLEVRDSRIGKGTFTKVSIPAGLPIVEIHGPVLLDREVPSTDNIDIYLQVGPNTYIGPSGKNVPEYLNHSCDPNCYVHAVGNRAILYSLYVIPENAELTFDYSITSTDTYDTWKMECRCGSNKCRKLISGFRYLDPITQDLYKKKDLVPLYILEPTMIQKR